MICGHYSPLWALACRTISFHFFLSATNSVHLLTPSTWRSLSTSSFHPFLGLPLLLVPSSSWVLPGFSMVCTFHVARVISVYFVFFRLSSFNLSSFYLCSTFVTISFFFFNWVGLLAPRQTPNLEDQDIPFCLGHHLWPVWHVRPN